MRTVVAAGVLFLLVVLTAGSWKTETRRVLYRDGVTEAPLRVKAMDAAKRTWAGYYEEHHLHQQQTFLGARFGQNPFDALVLQEILWAVKPDLTKIPGHVDELRRVGGGRNARPWLDWDAVTR